MNAGDERDEAFGAEVYRLPFAVQNAKRFVLTIFGGLTLMVSLWTALTLGSPVLSLEGESRVLFKGILVFFALLIVVGFSVTWWVLGRFPRALVVRERAVVLEHGARTRVVPFDEVLGLDQRDDGNSQVYVVLVAGGSDIPFGNDDGSREAARALVARAGLAWTEEPFKATRRASDQRGDAQAAAELHSAQ